MGWWSRLKSKFKHIGSDLNPEHMIKAIAHEFGKVEHKIMSVGHGFVNEVKGAMYGEIHKLRGYLYSGMKKIEHVGEVIGHDVEKVGGQIVHKIEAGGKVIYRGIEHEGKKIYKGIEAAGEKVISEVKRIEKPIEHDLYLMNKDVQILMKAAGKAGKGVGDIFAMLDKYFPFILIGVGVLAFTYMKK